MLLISALMRVVVRVAVAIVLHGLALHRFLGQLAGELHRPLRTGKHADLQGREGPAGVAVAGFGEELQGVVVQPHLVLAQAAAGVGRRAAQQRLDVVVAQRLELEDAAAADQGAVDGEERVLGRRPDEDHFALLHARQEHVLLGLVEAVDLVDEQQRPLAVGRQAVVGGGEHLAEFLHARWPPR